MKTATLATLCSAALLLGALAPAAAAKPGFAEHNDRLVLSNEQIEVSFQGKKPLLQVKDATNASRGFQVFVQRLVEVPASGELTGRAEVASFSMTGAEAWDVDHTEDADGITLTLHREGPLKVRGGQGKPEGVPPLPPDVSNATGNLTGNATNATTGNASVTLVFHLFARNTTVGEGNETTNITTHEVKFDLIVERWDWVSRANVLALEFLVAGASNATAPDADGDEVAVAQNGTRLGWVGWLGAANATVDGNSSSVPVTHKAGGRGGAGEPEGAKHWLVYGAPGFDRLVHDPSVGVEPTGEPATSGTARTPAPGVGLLLLAAPAAALLAARRRG